MTDNLSEDQRSMHVLLVHQNFAALDEPGGTRHHEMARYLTQESFRFSVITSGVSYLTGSAGRQGSRWLGRQVKDGVEILYSYTYSALHRSFVHRVISFFSFMVSSFLAGLSVKQVDLVWGTSPPIFQGITAWALARLKRVPFVFEVRDLWPAFAVAVGVLKHPLLIRASEWLERFLYRHADLVVINSPGFLEHVRQRGANRVEIIPNGADPRMFDPFETGASFRRKVRGQHAEDKFIALYAGAHGMSNHLEIVLEAAAQLRDRPDIAIVLLGDGKDKPALMDQANKMHLENVHFFSPVPKTEMAVFLAGADACLAILRPIPMYETVYPNKVFDYMAAGRPVVLAIGGVIRQVVEDAEAGIAVAPGNPDQLASALRTLADQPDRGRGMGLSGRRYVEEHFDRALLTNQMGELFRQLCSR